MSSEIFISVICPVYNEAEYITGCLESVLAQDYPHDHMEIFIVDGMSTDFHTREIVKIYSKKHAFIKLLDNPRRTVPYAMNIGIREARGAYIIRLDAHSLYPSDYFSKLIEYAVNLDSDNVGGICLTDVKNKNSRSLAIKEVLGNKFGVGDSLFRIGSDKITETDTVVFGCFKRNVFERFGYYDERLDRNQDIELNKRIKRGGGKLFLVPEIRCTYFARDTLIGIIKNNFQNGLWNILTIYYTQKAGSLSLRHFIPLLFVLSLIIPFVSALIYKPLILLALASLFFYIILFLSVSISITIKKKLNPFYLFVAFFCLHLSYGWGSLVGLINLLKTNNMILKFIFDRTFAFLALMLLGPVLLFIAALIKLKMPGGPIIFKQERIGRKGRLFTLFKFRTMAVNHAGNSVSVAGESRITPFGVYLRKHKLDELPELWNILKGDMSFVGPRPDVQGYVDLLVGEDRKILELRPGLTGPASLKYAHEEHLLATVENPCEYNDLVIFPDKVKINLHYYFHRTFFGDIKIICNTFSRVFDL